jgi:formylglycine-generating enzyme required for sulfatase activity
MPRWVAHSLALLVLGSVACGRSSNRLEPLAEGASPGVERTVLGIPLAWCPAGTFVMGSPPSEPERRPGETQKEVTLTRGFWIAKYETTQAQWKSVYGSCPATSRRSCPRETSSRSAFRLRFEPERR